MPQRRRTPRRVPARPRPATPFPVDVTDRGDTFEVAAELPGRRKQDLDITVRGDTLQIVAASDADREGRYLRRERGRGEVSRALTLPEPIDETHVSASYDNGVLWITLKKRRRPRSVDIV